MRFIFSQSPITNFAMTPELLDDLKDMFHPRPHFTAAAIPAPLAFTEGRVAPCAELDAPAHSVSFILLPQLFIDVSAVAINCCLLAVQQIFQVLRVMDFGGGYERRMRYSLGVGAHMQFHPEKPICAFARAAHFGIQLFFLILLRARGVDDRGIQQ